MICVVEFSWLIQLFSRLLGDAAKLQRLVIRPSLRCGMVLWTPHLQKLSLALSYMGDNLRPLSLTFTVWPWHIAFSIISLMTVFLQVSPALFRPVSELYFK